MQQSSYIVSVESSSIDFDFFSTPLKETQLSLLTVSSSTSTRISNHLGIPIPAEDEPTDTTILVGICSFERKVYWREICGEGEHSETSIVIVIVKKTYSGFSIHFVPWRYP